MKPDRAMDNNEQREIATDVKTSENRRKLIRGGLIGAPILLALKSTPVLACNCKLPSGFSTSGNLSRNGGATCTDPAKGPAWWPSHIGSDNKFSGTGVPKTTPFNSIFGGSDTRSFLTVLNAGISFASLVVAAYLDVKATSFVSGISDLNIKQMWSGTYKPTPTSVTWTLAQGENYLRYTMGLALNP